MRGIFAAEAHDARFLRALRMFFRASTGSLRARAQIASSEIVGSALFSLPPTQRIRFSAGSPTVVPAPAEWTQAVLRASSKARAKATSALRFRGRAAR